LSTAEQVDIAVMPVGLRGRQAQFHLDSAWAHAQLWEDSLAVIHLLDTERVAPEFVLTSLKARGLIQNLLGRKRRRAVPGLRGLALRAGVDA
ncbi:MAG: XRE family transcriptional regulator, partial [Actinobacteria bacterium]|nr:XRE family transcriptional regulator [Actinomycetota bacterium]